MNGMHDQSERFLRIKQIFYFESEQFRNYAVRPQQFLYFFPLPHGHGSFRPTFGTVRRTGRSSGTSPSPLSPVGLGWRARCGGISEPAVGDVGPSSRKRNWGKLPRKSSNARRFVVLRKRLCSTSFLMFAINSTNMS